MKPNITLNIIMKKKALILAILLLVLIFALYQSDKVMIDSPKKLSIFLAKKTNMDFFPLWSKITNAMFRFEDEINFLRFKKNLLDGKLPIYNLELDSEALGHFDNLSKTSTSQGYLDSEANEWRNAKLNVDGKDYKVKARLHGDAIAQWAHNSKSYRIDMKGEEYLSNIEEFNLILFEDRLFNGKITRLLAKELGLMDIRDDIVVLKINGVIQGLYYMQELLDYTFLEYNRCSNCEIIKITENFYKDHPFYRPGGIYWAHSHITPFDYELSNVDLPESSLDKGKILNSVNELFKDVNNDDAQGSVKHFDAEQISSFEALMMIIGDAKLVSGDNMRLVYRATNSKFYPIALNENIGKLELINSGFEHDLNMYGNRYSKLFYLLTQDDQTKHLRNKKAYSLASQSNILKEIDGLISRYELYALSYKSNLYNSRYLNYQIKNTKKLVESNLKTIKDALEYSKAYLNVIAKDNKITLEVIPDSIAEIKFDNLRINLDQSYSGRLVLTYVDAANKTLTKQANIDHNTDAIDLTEFASDLYFSAGLDENLYPEKRAYTIEIILDESKKVTIKSIDAGMINDITGEPISKNDVYMQIADGNDYYDIPDYFEFNTFKEQYPQFNWAYDDSTNQITLLKGQYTLDKDMIIPKLDSFIIDPGVTILIAANKSLVSYSKVNASGTKDEPIIIASSSPNAPFGVFAIIGKNIAGEASYINWLDLHGGNEKWINGLYLSGQFDIYHMDAVINNTSIYGSKSDDGFNVKYSNIIIDNSKFFENAVDQADLDFVDGVVKNSEFDSNIIGGDGLDLSGSKILVKNNKFLNSGDKGISIGEQTEAMLYKNIISNNKIGIAVKDLSKAYIFENNFNKNKIAIESYQKKPLFGGSFSYTYENEHVSNDREFSTDNKSKIYKANLADSAYRSLIENIKNDAVIFPNAVKNDGQS